MDRAEIDPELRATARRLGWLAARSEKGHRRFARLSTLMMRPLKGRGVKGLDVREERIPRPDGSALRVMVYRSPVVQEPVPGTVWIHGGGYALGVPEMGGPRFRDFIGAAPSVIVSPNYRLAPEAPYPAAIEDCYLTLEWMRDNAARLGVDPDRLIVGGESAGGGLTAALTLYARDKGDVAIAYQMPIYPMLDDRGTTRSATGNTAPVWNSKPNEWGWRWYLGELYGTQHVPPYASPARATDYTGLPPAFTFVGSIEPFHDETIEYMENLRRAGVEVRYEVFPGAFHGFDGLAPKSTASKRATQLMIDAYKEAVQTRVARQPRE